MELITNFFTKIQIAVASHQKIVQWLLYLSIIIIVGSFTYTIFDRSTAPFWYKLGHQSANWSLITFLLTLIPGMIKRFKLKGPFIPIGATLMILRKEIGIIMFLLAFTHYGWSRALPTIVTDGNLLKISFFEQFGMVALLLALPMFITSNDYLIEKMGDWWKRLHSMAYIIVWALFFHLVLLDIGIKTLVTLVFASLEWTSLFKEKYDKHYSDDLKSPM